MVSHLERVVGRSNRQLCYGSCPSRSTFPHESDKRLGNGLLNFSNSNWPCELLRGEHGIRIQGLIKLEIHLVHPGSL